MKKIILNVAIALLAPILSSSIASASGSENVFTRCEDIRLEVAMPLSTDTSPNPGSPMVARPVSRSATLLLSREGALREGELLTTVLGEPSESAELRIPGLKVELLKAVDFDSEVKGNFGIGGPQRWETTFIGTTFKVSADVAIGRELMGCLMVPVKELTVRTICTQHKSLPVDRQ